MTTTLKIAFLVLSIIAVSFGLWQMMDGAIAQNWAYVATAAIVAVVYVTLGAFFYQKWFGNKAAS